MISLAWHEQNMDGVDWIGGWHEKVDVQEEDILALLRGLDFLRLFLDCHDIARILSSGYLLT